ncbi:hypothetical protein MCC01972_12210 [Bifidobacteriaceae bacterium MCC01972]|nr:hypothetical protein MCC01972_12210 [Bifidobacteriaceae bacterium MCC01972]GDZ00439.1 hypothetical protein MCC01975_17700 [Bifidobacteriaceae bacterium MCC01975]
MMKQKRIVAVALGLALSVSPMIVLPTAFADQVSGNPSSSISARSTAPNPLDKFNPAEKAFLNNHKDKIASALGIDGFDPSTTDYYSVKESSLDTVAGKIPTANTGLLKPMGAPLEIDTNATGWLVDGKIAKDKPSSGDMAYRVTIKGKSGGTVAYTLHTASQDASSKADPGELKGVTATANGTAVKDFNPVKDGTWTVPDGAEVKLSGLPDGWASYKNLDAKPGTLSYDIKKGDVTVVTWTFTYDSTTDPDKPATGVDALKGVAATVDGKPLPSFDPTKSGTYRVATGAEVKILNVPSDWKLDKTASDSKLVFAASKDGTTVTWTFEYQGKDDGGATTNPGDNAGNKSQNNNDGTASKPPVNGANPLASTGVGIGWVGWLIGILAIIGGALGITVAVRKPKGKATDETPAPEADDSEASSDQPLNS